jgi:hypothetical protein
MVCQMNNVMTYQKNYSVFGCNFIKHIISFKNKEGILFFIKLLSMFALVFAFLGTHFVIFNAPLLFHFSFSIEFLASHYVR